MDPVYFVFRQRYLHDLTVIYGPAALSKHVIDRLKEGQLYIVDSPRSSSHAIFVFTDSVDCYQAGSGETFPQDEREAGEKTSQCTVVSETLLMTDNNVHCTKCTTISNCKHTGQSFFQQTQKFGPDKCPFYFERI